MQHNIFSSDIKVLKKLYCPNADQISIFDPHDKLVIDEQINFKSVFQSTFDIADLNPNKNYLFINISDKIFQKLLLLDNVSIIHFNNNNQGEVFHYLINPDKTIRWIFPKNNKFPVFLNLYNGSGIKAAMFKKVSKLFYRIGLKNIIKSSSFTFFNKNKKNALHQITNPEFAIFTGTIGENRKAVIALNKENKCTHYLKIPFSKKAKKNIFNELNQLRQLNQNYHFFDCPTIEEISNGIKISNVANEESTNSTILSDLHLNALKEIYETSTVLKNIQELNSWKSINNNTNAVYQHLKNSKHPNKALFIKINNKTNKIANKINDHKKIKVALAHGDFTPWNMFINKEKLAIYDWELSRSDLPLFYDAIHFIFQSSILIERASFKEIQQKLVALKNNDICKNTLTQKEQSFETSYQFYLLFTISYYLPLYAQQEHLHEQAIWLCEIWLEALEFELSNEYYTKQADQSLLETRQ